MVECGGLENRLACIRSRGFESLLLRHFGSDILPYPGPFLSVYAGAGVVANAIRSTEPLFAAALRQYDIIPPCATEFASANFDNFRVSPVQLFVTIC